MVSFSCRPFYFLPSPPPLPRKNLTSFPQSSPDELVELQDKLWRPLVSWAEVISFSHSCFCLFLFIYFFFFGGEQEHFKIKFAVNADDAIILAPHPPETVKTLSDYVSKLNSWELIGFEHAVRASKSVIIPLALNHRVVSVDQAADGTESISFFFFKIYFCLILLYKPLAPRCSIKSDDGARSRTHTTWTTKTSVCVSDHLFSFLAC